MALKSRTIFVVLLLFFMLYNPHMDTTVWTITLS